MIKNAKLLPFDNNYDIVVKEFIRTKKIKDILTTQEKILNESGSYNIKFPPLTEAILDFLFLDKRLLEAQGQEFTFDDLVEDLVFVTY